MQVQGLLDEVVNTQKYKYSNAFLLTIIRTPEMFKIWIIAS